MAKKADSPAEKRAAAFTKSQLMASEAFAARRDLLSSLLEDGKEYTHAQAKALIDEFDKKVFVKDGER